MFRSWDLRRCPHTKICSPSWTRTSTGIKSWLQINSGSSFKHCKSSPAIFRYVRQLKPALPWHLQLAHRSRPPKNTVRELLLQILASQIFFVLGMFYSALKAVQDDRACQARVAQQIQQVVQSNSSENDVRKALKSWLWDDVDKELLTQEQFLFSGATLCSHLPEQGVKIHSLYEVLKFEHSIIIQVCSSLLSASVITNTFRILDHRIDPCRRFQNF